MKVLLMNKNHAYLGSELQIVSDYAFRTLLLKKVLTTKTLFGINFNRFLS